MKNKNIIYTLMTFIGAIISFSMITSCINYDLGSANTGAIPTDSFTISVNQMIVRDPWIKRMSFIICTRELLSAAN
mgnify:CR=1 FL=1